MSVADQGSEGREMADPVNANDEEEESLSIQCQCEPDTIAASAKQYAVDSIRSERANHEDCDEVLEVDDEPFSNLETELLNLNVHEATMKLVATEDNDEVLDVEDSPSSLSLSLVGASDAQLVDGQRAQVLQKVSDAAENLVAACAASLPVILAQTEHSSERSVACVQNIEDQAGQGEKKGEEKNMVLELALHRTHDPASATSSEENGNVQMSNAYLEAEPWQEGCLQTPPIDPEEANIASVCVRDWALIHMPTVSS